MPSNDEFVRFLAAWALVHETADEGWKAAVERGADDESGEMGSRGPDAFVDGLSAMVFAEKERLKAELASGVSGATGSDDVTHVLEELRFEVAEMRGRMESMQATLDAVAARLDAR